MLSWFGDFFGALPEAGRALWQLGDPQSGGEGWWGIIIVLIWGVGLTALPIAVARRTYGKHEWVSATMGVIAATAVFWWIYGILPSAWLYYVDSNKEILEHAVIPSSLSIRGQVIASNLYQVIRDTVVVIEHLLAFGVTFWAAIAIQKRYPRGFAPGEEKREAGGYH